jgi:hypothetical protein
MPFGVGSTLDVTVTDRQSYIHIDCHLKSNYLHMTVQFKGHIIFHDLWLACDKRVMTSAVTSLLVYEP